MESLAYRNTDKTLRSLSKECGEVVEEVNFRQSDSDSAGSTDPEACLILAGVPCNFGKLLAALLIANR